LNPSAEGMYPATYPVWPQQGHGTIRRNKSDDDDDDFDDFDELYTATYIQPQRYKHRLS